MEQLIFVDASAWVAIVLPSDDNHKLATDWYRQNDKQLLTSDYLIDETLTVLVAKGQKPVALEIGEAFFSGELAIIDFASQIDVINAWQTFRQFNDKKWSFTDCVSRVSMKRLEIAKVFSFDHHFRQFGNVEIVP